MAYAQGTPCGYFGLDGSDGLEGTVELAYFGLMSSFVGKGIGSRAGRTARRDAGAVAGSREEVATPPEPWRPPSPPS
ncbi:hypothetical protein [Amycolatopsis regifaucium]|uniref:hypothetical protein n=1 Tax=Amycolatopsis regifaucium TaxID=546365 RepID=UPI00313463BB